VVWDIGGRSCVWRTAQLDLSQDYTLTQKACKHPKGPRLRRHEGLTAGRVR